MRILFLATIFLLVNTANGFSLTAKKKGTDAEGNCVPELLSENARLYTEIDVLQQVATLAESQVKSPDAGSKKLGLEGVKNLNAKAKSTRQAIKRFADTYGDVACKAQVMKGGKAEVITFKMSERISTLDKLAAPFEENSAKWLKTLLANK